MHGYAYHFAISACLFTRVTVFIPSYLKYLHITYPVGRKTDMGKIYTYLSTYI